jgi:hypothetical protein
MCLSSNSGLFTPAERTPETTEHGAVRYSGVGMNVLEVGGKESFLPGIEARTD